MFQSALISKDLEKQQEAIVNLLKGKDVLVLQPTGCGNLDRVAREEILKCIFTTYILNSFQGSKKAGPPPDWSPLGV